MKSIAAQFCEAQDALIAKGVTMEAIKDAVKDAVNEEHRLSIVLDLKKKHITESGRPVRVKKNNGSAFTESAPSTEERVQTYMKSMKMSFREATIATGGKDPGPNAKPSAQFIESLFKEWKRYCSLLSDSECKQLAEKGISPK